MARALCFSRRIGLILFCLGLFGCDHATKLAAHATLMGAKPVSIAPHLELLYTENPDTAFSLLRTFGVGRNMPVLLLVSSLALVLVAVLWARMRKTATRGQHIAWALVFSGALGNVVDRAFRGVVIDFIHLSHWPVFNVADIAVVAGVILLFVTSRRRRPAEA